MQGVVHTDKRRLDVARDLPLDERGEARKRLELGRQDVEERRSEDVEPLYVGHVGVDGRRDAALGEELLTPDKSLKTTHEALFADLVEELFVGREGAEGVVLDLLEERRGFARAM